jgi:hypothetical protein
VTERSSSSFPDYVFSQMDLQPPQPAALDWDLLAGLMDAYADLPPIEPIKLTQEQWDAAKATIPVESAPQAWVRQPIFGVPVVIVDRIQDSTLFERWVEKVRAEYASAPPEPFLDFGTSGEWEP